MATTMDYINQLKKDKQALVDNLTERNVTVSSDETFTSLVPKILDVRYAKPNYIRFAGDSSVNINLSWLRTDQMTKMDQMFSNCVGVKSLDLSNFDTSNVTNMEGMFKQCNNLESIDVSNFDTSKVVNMADMFYTYYQATGGKLTSIVGLENFDTSNVKTIDNLFRNTGSLTDLSGIENWNVEKVTSMSGAFSGSGIESIDLSKWNFASATTITLFNGASKLVTANLQNFCKSNHTAINNIFYGCTSLQSIGVTDGTGIDITGWNTSNVTDMSNMFYNCTSLTNINLSVYDTTNVTNMSNMFYGCTTLTELDLSNFVSANVTKVTSMFNNCKALAKLDIRNMTFDNVTAYTNMLNNVPKTCQIIVGGDTQKEWFNTKFSAYTNVVTVAELGE